ncbi:AAA family ATPase [Ktedonosporobacter rubrisoli]|uniref:AAA family ATPase n=1 Tax=Ktedonosporobacter rubrisoli TaxID=2509675 RepID=A0A4P6JZE1_KTERU|nr:nucleoside-triphosphatase [Ktedonosporobacter rubrisoli]QBD81104.1 AAA family ATPase [Ktedonosporobacter rubrisoli]
MKQAYMLTGKPRVGKTNLIRAIIVKLGKERCGGFYTEEIRDERFLGSEARRGFRLVTLDGKEGILAHVDFSSELRLGRYGLNLACLEAIGVPALTRAWAADKLLVIDEIGLIQAYSDLFRHAIIKLLADAHPFLSTIAIEPHPWLDNLKQHHGVELYKLTPENYQATLIQLSSQLRPLLH